MHICDMYIYIECTDDCSGYIYSKDMGTVVQFCAETAQMSDGAFNSLPEVLY